MTVAELTKPEMEDIILTKDHFATMYEMMQQEKDPQNATKIIDLYEKFQFDQFNICFAGHFSAGKSSIINNILDREVLPKSPIPTSANIVKITSGEGAAKVYFKQAPAIKYMEPYDIDLIKDYAMDKDTIQQIEISTKDPILPKNAALLDTPGIDAADDADRLMTESAIHLIDVLYYVMDYNHVQSEVNLYFLLEMKKRGIPINLIINQIDKHQEDEIPFTAYKERVKQTFDQWGIHPEHIFFSSVLQQHHPHNQLTAIKELLFEQMHRPPEGQEQIQRAFLSVLDEHKKMLQSDITADESESSESVEQTILQQLLEEKEEVSEKSNQLKRAYMEEVQTTLKNAYLMPAALRDKAQAFLEAQEKGFKVGGLFNAKKKTAAEQEERTNAFLQALKESMETTIQWKLREKATELLQAYHLADEHLLEQAQQLSISLDEMDLSEFMKPGAQVNGNYVLNYTNDLSQSIKSKYRQAANNLWQYIADAAEQQTEMLIRDLNERLAPLEAYQEQYEEQLAVLADTENKIAMLDEALVTPEINDMNESRLLQALESRNQIELKETPERREEPAAIHQENQVVNERKEDTKQAYGTEGIVASIEEVITAIERMDGFSAITEELQDKQTRLTNRQLTIALFGTFSAGKSSFSNALFGEAVLPVSPNPTTAVISRISPVTDNKPHGTVKITLKTEITLLADIKAMTPYLEAERTSLEAALQWIQKERVFEHDSLSKTYQSYLEALLQGYEAQKSSIGQTLDISLEDFAAFVTDETKACYIEQVDLYYDCALTRKGITLVDTPGADSVNARHTNVAFDYIKEADAILYVTYFNHAITSGDRDFLMQLGRVKDSFEMDKMFFIVNASDLADTKEDLNMVVHYVGDQLQQFGIRQPKIFPVSSKLSLQEKMAQKPLNTEMQQFEEAFFAFIEKDLIALTIDSSIWDMKRAKWTLEEFIQSQTLDESAKSAKRNQLIEQKEAAVTRLHELTVDVYEQRLTDRIERQLHFVLERLYIRFHDMFTEHFNASTINASGKKAAEQLQQCRNRFIQYTGYELLQEVRAVSLRIEGYMRELQRDLHQQLQQEAEAIHSSFVLGDLNKQELSTPEYMQAFETLDVGIFQKALKRFKNTKSFFEQNERKKMEEDFYNILQPYTAAYLKDAHQLMQAQYTTSWQQIVKDEQEMAIGAITFIADEHVKMLSKKVNMEVLHEKNDQLQQIIGRYEQE